MARQHGRKVDTSELAKLDEAPHHLADQLERTELRNRVLTLIRNGATSTQVCEVIPELTPEKVKGMVKSYLDKVHTEDALTLEQMRVLENERLDGLWRALTARLHNPDGSLNLKIVDRLTRLSERRSRMNGVEAAKKHEVYIGNALEVLGVEAEHIERGRQAWLEAGEEEIEDAEVVG